MINDLRQRAQSHLVARRRRRLARGRSLGPNRVTLALLGLLVLLLGLVWWSISFLGPVSGEPLTLDELDRLASTGQIATAELRDEDAQVVVTLSRSADVAPQAESYVASYPKSDAATAALLTRLTTAGAEVTVDPQPGKAAVRLLLTVLLPLIILADLFALFLTWSRGGSSGLGEVEDFGRIGDRQAGSGAGGPRFEDVGGADEAVVELREVVDYLQHPEPYQELGASAPKGVLLFGPPGCGKTLLARAVAAEAGVPFFSVAGAEFVESLVGVGAARVRDLFRKVRAVAPAIVFIDEIDAAGRRRGSGDAAGGTDEREQTLNQLLVEMDGFDASSGIVIIGATNRPDILDPALLRPGRFDRHVTVERPDLASRQRILELHASRRTRVAPSVDFGDLARRTPGFTGADLANVVNEAALLAIREDAPEIIDHHFGEAILRVMGGPRRRGHLMSDAERRRLAVHEAGHAIVAARRLGAAEVLRVSLVARGRAAAAIGLGGGDDGGVRSADALFDELVAVLAGAAAEELRLGDASTAAEDDVERATALAQELAGRYGLSPTLGRRRLLGSATDTYLGSTIRLADVSPALHERFDAEVDRWLAEAAAAAAADLTAAADHLDALVDALLEHETLEGTLLTQLLAPGPAARNGRAGRHRTAKSSELAPAARS